MFVNSKVGALEKWIKSKGARARLSASPNAYTRAIASSPCSLCVSTLPRHLPPTSTATVSLATCLALSTATLIPAFASRRNQVSALAPLLPFRSALPPCATSPLLLTRDVEDRRASHRSSRPHVSGLTSPGGAPASSCRAPSNAPKRADAVALLFQPCQARPCSSLPPLMSHAAAPRAPGPAAHRAPPLPQARAGSDALTKQWNRGEYLKPLPCPRAHHRRPAPPATGPPRQRHREHRLCSGLLSEPRASRHHHRTTPSTQFPSGRPPSPWSTFHSEFPLSPPHKIRPPSRQRASRPFPPPPLTADHRNRPAPSSPVRHGHRALFPVWVGQFRPIGTVGLFILLWINLNNSNDIQTSEISRKLNKFHKNMKPLLIFEFKYIL
jgi:hypothetical protein